MFCKVQIAFAHFFISFDLYEISTPNLTSFGKLLTIYFWFVVGAVLEHDICIVLAEPPVWFSIPIAWSSEI